MVKKCDSCGAKIENDDSFCKNCGKPIKNDKNRIIPVLSLIVIILIVFIILFATGIIGSKMPTDLTIESYSPISNSQEFNVKLTSNNQPLVNKNIKIEFVNDDNTYTFNEITSDDGVASFIPDVNSGEYEVKCYFEGDADYSESGDSDTFNMETKVTEISNDVTSSGSEPDYESFYYSHSFEDTDTNGDGYVTLSDFNIAHTPSYIVNQMFSDSDDDNDGKLNYNEYYKFMYKLNYDKSSYGL